MGTKTVVFGYISPPSVDNSRPVGLGANAIFPMVGIRKTATWPAQVGNFEFDQGVDHVFAHAVYSWNFGVVFAHVNSIVDAPAQVLGKVAVDVLADGVLAKVGIEYDLVLTIQIDAEPGKQQGQIKVFHWFMFTTE